MNNIDQKRMRYGIIRFEIFIYTLEGFIYLILSIKGTDQQLLGVSDTDGTILPILQLINNSEG